MAHASLTHAVNRALVSAGVMLRRLPSHYPSLSERRADVWVHGVGLAAACSGAIVLVALSAREGTVGQTVAIAIYGIGLIAMLLCSTAYNLTVSPARQRVLRRFDHAAIFLLIACSYTPFTTQRLAGDWAFWMTTAVWITAAVGIAIKLFVPDVPKKWSLASYLACGWIALIAIKPMMASVPRNAMLLLGLGGIVYSLGVPIYAAKQLKFRRAIWHGHVIVAAAIHWAAVFVGVVATP